MTAPRLPCCLVEGQQLGPAAALVARVALQALVDPVVAAVAVNILCPAALAFGASALPFPLSSAAFLLLSSFAPPSCAALLPNASVVPEVVAAAQIADPAFPGSSSGQLAKPLEVVVAGEGDFAIPFGSELSGPDLPEEAQ